MNTILSFEHVSFSYDREQILDDISFHISENEFAGIIGPNGGGKTTLLKLIMGFLKPSQGIIRVFGHTPQAARHLIAYVPQTLRFDKQFPISVMEMVLSGRLAHLPWHGQFSKKDEELALHALEQVDLVDFRNHSFGTLSGGQAQRALIARALVSDPKLLLLDEPTASVDSKAEADIYSVLESLRNKMTILMVTHDLKAAIEHVNRVLCVQRQLIEYSPQEVCQHFAMGLYHPPLLQIKRGQS